MTQDFKVDLGGLWDRLKERLQENGIEVDFPEGFDFTCGDQEAGRVKIVCVAPDLKSSVDELGKKPREHVVMVRVGNSTLEDLDAWVATGAVKSRSEAAALFIKEGLSVREDELERMRDALRELREAQEKLRNQAKQVFGS